MQQRTKRLVYFFKDPGSSTAELHICANVRRRKHDKHYQPHFWGDGRDDRYKGLPLIFTLSASFFVTEVFLLHFISVTRPTAAMVSRGKPKFF